MTINRQYLSHMYTAVNPSTNQLGLMNYWSDVLTFDTDSYRANWYSLTFDTDPSYCFISQARWKLIFASDLYGRLQQFAFGSPL